LNVLCQKSKCCLYTVCTDVLMLGPAVEALYISYTMWTYNIYVTCNRNSFYFVRYLATCFGPYGPSSGETNVSTSILSLWRHHAMLNTAIIACVTFYITRWPIGAETCSEVTGGIKRVAIVDYIYRVRQASFLCIMYSSVQKRKLACRTL
jgi:hypothetical protein